MNDRIPRSLRWLSASVPVWLVSGMLAASLVPPMAFAQPVSPAPPAAAPLAHRSVADESEPLPTPQPAPPSSFKFQGVWVRPEASPTSVTLQLDNIAKAGFNAVYVETFYHGHTIFPSRYVPMRPEMEGTDYLALYINEGWKRGLRIHAWIEVFYWEVDTNLYPEHPRTPLFDDHPQWRAILRDGQTTDAAEHAHIFANPADPAVRRFLVNYLEELLENYPVDGLNLDYIRYPDGEPDAGYDDLTLEVFKMVSGLDAREIPKDPDNPQWQQWVKFREQQVLMMVREIKEMKDRVRREAVLSAAVFPREERHRYSDNKFQDWRAMLSPQYLDAIAPMCYAYDPDSIKRQIRAVMAEIPRGVRIDVLPVVAVQRRMTDMYSGRNHAPMSEKLPVFHSTGVPGFSVFCYSWILDSDEGLTLLEEKPLSPMEGAPPSRSSR